MVNNRAYGQVLTYGSGVQWGWHEDGSLEDRARNVFMDLLMGSNQLYLPPLGSATVGILKPSAGADVTFTIWPTWQTVGADFAFYVLGQVQHLPIEKGFNSVVKAGVGACGAIGPEKVLTGVSIASLRDDFGKIASCVEEAFSLAVATGVMNSQQVGQLKSWYGTIKNAKVLSTGLLVADVVWKVGDLVSDAILRDMPRGNGFEVQAVRESKPTVTPPTVTPPTVTPPTVTPKTYPEQVWSSTGVNTFTNFHNASGMGTKLAHNQWIEVSCKVYDPTIASVNPDGYWYRIASSPWSNAYYSPANSFYNGDPPGGPYTHATDWSVPNC
jgi:hypothetical protein